MIVQASAITSFTDAIGYCTASEAARGESGGSSWVRGTHMDALWLRPLPSDGQRNSSIRNSLASAQMQASGRRL